MPEGGIDRLVGGKVSLLVGGVRVAPRPHVRREHDLVWGLGIGKWGLGIMGLVFSV